MTARALASKLALSVALLGFAWIAGRQALGDFLVQGPRADVDRMLAGRVAPDAAMLARDRATLLRALAVDRSNAQAWEFVGQIDATRAAMAAGDLARHRALVDSALADYAAALALRPNSPYLWVDRMSLLEQAAMLRPLRAAEVGQFRVAMRRAVDFGPWETGLLRAVVAAAQAMQPALDESSRAAAREAAAHLAVLGIAPQQRNGQ